MGRKLTEDVIKSNLKSIGFTLNSYDRDAKSKLCVNITCENGHTDDFRYDTIMSRKTCKYCEGYEFTYEYVKSYVESYNQILLSESYENARSNLEIQCEFEHTYYPTFDNFKNKGSRCPICQELSKYTYEEAKEYVESFKYSLLSQDYINNKFLLEVMCDKGHNHYVSFDNFKNKGKIK